MKIFSDKKKYENYDKLYVRTPVFLASQSAWYSPAHNVPKIKQ